MGPHDAGSDSALRHDISALSDRELLESIAFNATRIREDMAAIRVVADNVQEQAAPVIASMKSNPMLKMLGL